MSNLKINTSIKMTHSVIISFFFFLPLFKRKKKLGEEEINKLKDEIIQLTKRVETTTCNLNVKKEQYDKVPSLTKLTIF